MRKQIRNTDSGRRNTKWVIISFALCLAWLALPQGVALGAEYYCDPVTGNINNDGSAGSPWGRVQDVFDNGLMRNLNPGDIVYLRDGYHGDIVYSNQHNADYITVEAQAGHTPEVRRIRLTDVGYWIFRGLKVSPELAPTYNPSNPERYFLFEIKGSSNNVTLENSELYFIDDSSGWSASDWASLFVIGSWGDGDSGTCAVNLASGNGAIIRNNIIRNVYFGIMVEGANNTLVEYNTIENIAGDGMQVKADNIVVQYNTLKNFYDVDLNHDDSIQSWSTTSGEVHENITIRGNYIVARDIGETSPLIGSPAATQATSELK